LVETEGVSVRKIIPVANGIDTDIFEPSSGLRWAGRRLLGLDHEGLLVVTVGILKEHKGQRYLVDAAASLMPEFPQLRVALVGAPISLEDEVYVEGLRDRTRKLGLAERFLFPGMQRDVRPMLAAADIYAHPSLHEGSSNAVLEAMAMGCACVVSDVTGCPELVAHGAAGLIVPQRDPVALADALRTLLTNGERRRTLGSRARQRAVDDYGVRRMCSECEEVARRGLREKGVELTDGKPGSWTQRIDKASPNSMSAN